MSIEPITSDRTAVLPSTQDELVQANLRVLIQLQNALSALDEEQFTGQPSEEISSIGMHTRHIIEFYQEFFKALEGPADQELCYDRRQRNMVLEGSRDKAIAAVGTLEKMFKDTDFIDGTIPMLCIIDPHAPLCNLQSTVHRELYHVLDHCIHHMALIKMVGQQLNIEFDQDFGLANATKQHRNNA